MGIDSDRFVTDNIDDGLLCSICSEVLEKPLMVDICEHTYCGQCVRQWLNVNKICPICRIAICDKDLVSIPRYMKNQLNGLKLRCTHASRGCQYESALDCMEFHEKNCTFDEINTRITRKINNDLLESSHMSRIDKYRYRYQYHVIRFSMSEEMKKHAIKLTKEALYLCGRVDFGQISAYIKTHLEPEQNKFWHCIAGTAYDCLLTANDCYITIKIDGIYIIAFKTK